jgi:phosphate transport system permease protein
MGLQTESPQINSTTRLRVATRSQASRLRSDRIARWIVTLGGVTIIASILAILLVIIAEVYPLALKSTATPIGTVDTTSGSPLLAIGVDEYRQVACRVTETEVEFVDMKGAGQRTSPEVPGLNGATIVAVSAVGRGPFCLGLSDGRAIPIEIRFEVSYAEGDRQVRPELIAADPLTIDPQGRPIRLLTHVATSDGSCTAAADGPRSLALVLVKQKRGLVGPSRREETRGQLALPGDGDITALALDDRLDELYVGTSSGKLLVVDLRDFERPLWAGVVEAASRTNARVTALAFLLGDRTLIVGDSAGGVSSFQLLQSEAGNRRLTKMHDFQAHGGAVVAIATSERDKGFLTADASGTVQLHYGTTGATLLSIPTGAEAARAVTMGPKADGLLAADASGRLYHWALSNPHPEITLRSLFGKVWYEGYTEPEYVWQSTGGTDDFEAKFSLTPLVFGTLKGTCYALLFALPLAVLGALYTSQFMHPTIRGLVKPTVEIMAALPSVVLGFIAGLWLAPMMEQVVPGLFLMPLVIPLCILSALALWQLMPLQLRGRFRSGTELMLLIPVVIVGGWLAFQLGSAMESQWLGGDYRHWLLSTLGLTYDQRNSLVVGFAMGFAVIPIIFTIAEDSLSNVPQHLTAGSLALGATRWQTATRIVLPTASPGIFSAIMIGFGRAVGETMIVLMATGNTPVMDWSIFNGFRALSANIAVELPEAPEKGSLYRVLFLAALLLFLITFIVNTAAELVRLRLRRRYRYL